MKQSKFGMVLAALWIPTLSSASNPSQSQIDQINDNPAIVHPVGSCYGGGVVFYVNTTPGAPAGQHGLIAALHDASNGALYDWDTNGETPTVITPLTAYFTGAENTANILAAIGPTRAQAAYAATQTTDGGYSDWYLPSRDELMTMYTQANFNGETFWTNCGGTAPNSDDFPNSTYWSSSQFMEGLVWNVSFSSKPNFTTGGSVVYMETNRNLLAVRAIRTF